MKISFLGDISLNDDYVEYYKNGVNPFLNLQTILKSDDYVVGNLECLTKGEKGENLLKKPRLTTTVETLNYLKLLNVNIVSLAHNHVYDHLEDGFVKTTEFLHSNSIRYLGAGPTMKEAKKPIILSGDEFKIGFLNFVTNDTHPNLPENAPIILNYFAEDSVTKEIKELKDSVDHIVLLLHWGGRVEGGMFPDYDQPQLARRLIDAGADLIIGHHSHTFHPYELYKGKYIFYSLGNFCFSDFIFDGRKHHMPPSRMVTGIVSITFSKNNYSVETNFFLNQKTQYLFLPDYNKKLKIRNNLFRNVLKFHSFWRIYYVYKKYFMPVKNFISRNDLDLFEKLKRISKAFKRRLT
ncbi:MAG: CapA family protein [Bacteroidetes bacterium]|nr:CapA family protein [Bacteroidota bacterium]